MKTHSPILSRLAFTCDCFLFPLSSCVDGCLKNLDIFEHNIAQAMYNVFKQTSSDVSSMLNSSRVFASLIIIIYVYLNDPDVMQYLQLETVMHSYMSASMTFRVTRTARRVRIRPLYIILLFLYRKVPP